MRSSVLGSCFSVAAADFDENRLPKKLPELAAGLAGGAPGSAIAIWVCGSLRRATRPATAVS